MRVFYTTCRASGLPAEKIGRGRDGAPNTGRISVCVRGAGTEGDSHPERKTCIALATKLTAG